MEVYGQWLRNQAELVRPKKRGPCASWCVTRNGGSADVDVESRTGVLLDADDVGLLDDFLASLRAVGVAYAMQQRTGTTRYHVEIPFAAPVGVDGTADAWKPSYRRRLGWLLGWLSEIGGLDCKLERHKSGVYSVSKLGFDAATDRLAQLDFVYTRATGDAAIPFVDARDGLGIDFDGFLAATGFIDDEEREHADVKRAAQRVPHAGRNTSSRRNGTTPQEPPAGVSSESSTPEDSAPPPAPAALDDPWWRAFFGAGWILRERSSGGKQRWIAKCPWSDEHSTPSTGEDDSNSSTVILPPRIKNGRTEHARFYCSHASCGNRTRDDVYMALPQHARDIIDESRAHAGIARLRAMMQMPTRSDPLLTRDEVAERVARVVLEPRIPGRVVLLVAPCGSGKSHGVIAAARMLATMESSAA